MTANPTEQMIQEYLDRVSRQLPDLNPSERAELIDDLRSHINEAIGDVGNASDSDVRNVLDRLGSPQDVAREARSRLSEPVARQSPGPSLQQEQRKSPGALEVAAIILTALFWPIGVLLAWISDRWLTRDKVVATVIPFVATVMLGSVIVLGLGLVAWGGESTTVVSVVDEPRQVQPSGPMDPEPRSPQQISEHSEGGAVVSRLVIVIGFLAGIVAGPFVAAVYLAVRLQPTPNQTASYRNQHHSREGAPAGGHA